MKSGGRAPESIGSSLPGRLSQWAKESLACPIGRNQARSPTVTSTIACWATCPHSAAESDVRQKGTRLFAIPAAIVEEILPMGANFGGQGNDGIRFHQDGAAMKIFAQRPKPRH